MLVSMQTNYTCKVKKKPAFIYIINHKSNATHRVYKLSMRKRL